jgi:hypothetical protein
MRYHYAIRAVIRKNNCKIKWYSPDLSPVGSEGVCQKERGFRGPGFRSAKLTECLALPERQSASAMVLTKPNPTMWPIKKEGLAPARTTQNKQPSHKQYNHSVATPIISTESRAQRF